MSLHLIPFTCFEHQCLCRLRSKKASAFGILIRMLKKVLGAPKNSSPLVDSFRPNMWRIRHHRRATGLRIDVVEELVGSTRESVDRYGIGVVKPKGDGRFELAPGGIQLGN